MTRQGKHFGQISQYNNAVLGAKTRHWGIKLLYESGSTWNFMRGLVTNHANVMLEDVKMSLMTIS